MPAARGKVDNCRASVRFYVPGGETLFNYHALQHALQVKPEHLR
jgi:hypothetical protein